MRAILFDLYAYQDRPSYERNFSSGIVAYMKGKIFFILTTLLVSFLMMFSLTFTDQTEIKIERNALQNHLNHDQSIENTGIVSNEKELYASSEQPYNIGSLKNNTQTNTISYTGQKTPISDSNTFFLESAHTFFNNGIITRNNSSLVYHKGVGKLIPMTKSIGAKRSAGLSRLVFQNSSPAISDSGDNKYHFRC